MTYKVKNALVILTDTFRLKDNPALYYASQNFTNIMLVYIHNNNYLGRPLGEATQIFLHYILKSFSSELKQKYNATLNLYLCENNNDYINILQNLVSKYNIQGIFFSKHNNFNQNELNKVIAEKFNSLTVKQFLANTLFNNEDIKTNKNATYSVYTPFSNKCLEIYDTKKVNIHPKPQVINSIVDSFALNLDQLNLLPKHSWYNNMVSYWQFDYAKIDEMVDSFFKNNAINYHNTRNLLDIDGTSKFSPYLRFGVLSIKELFAKAHNPENYNLTFIKELLWREFAYYSHSFYPQMHIAEIKPNFANFEWNDNMDFLKKWQYSKTGFKIIDAAMNELYQTGYMHNRARMLVASFLTKHLQVNWRFGEQWFFNTLVDADFASNPFSWQWVFGSGLDAAPYFRIFNPTLQQEKFDPQQIYINKWLPKNYNEQPIIDLKTQGAIALGKYKALF
jgi:deoxyribodipyrimidine photo-lyase